MSLIQGGYATGTVVRYTPANGRHCREGIAIANEHGFLADTFWRTGGNTLVTDAEAPSIEVLFHLADYDEIDEWRRESARWLTYHPNDRRVITSQHGLQHRWFIRKGAKPDHATQVANAEEAVGEAERNVASAQRTLAWRQEELERLRGAS